MLMMTAKVDKKKILIAVSALLAAVVFLLALTSGTPANQETSAAPSAGSNEGRIKFLQNLGWDVNASPIQSTQVRIPDQADDVFNRYNALQQSQGYDLTKYAGKTVMRYLYQVNNHPEAAGPVYATLLVYQDQIIGGDITDSGPGGRIYGFSSKP